MILGMSNIAWSPEDRFVAYAMLAEAGAFGLEVAPCMLFSRSSDPLRPEQQEERRALAEIAGAGLTLVSMQSLLLESVRRDHAGLHSFLSMSLIEARRRKARPLRLRFSQSFANRLHRPSQAKVRSTTHLLGRTTKPFA